MSDAAQMRAEGLMTLAKAGRSLPSRVDGRTVHPSTIWRWATKGVRVRGSRRVRLETCRIGTTVYTSAAAVERLIAALSEPPESEEAAVPIRTPGQRRRAHEAAEKQLESVGI